MYDTALPPETLNTLVELGMADIVVGIPSYRNGRTIQHVTAAVAHALSIYYPTLSAVILHADGLAYDETLQLAQAVAMPSNVRQVTTRYLGLPGKGSALRAIFEASTLLQAHAVVVIEADTESISPAWIPALAEPILRKEANFVLPYYGGVAPTAFTNDLLAYPLIQGLYDVNLRYPMAGDVAMAGGVAAYFADRDVWETDVARDGIDGWMALQMVADGGQIAQVPLPAKIHRAYETLTGMDIKFLQEAGIVLRTGLLHERVWHDGEHLPFPLIELGIPSIDEETPLPDAELYWQEGIQGVRYEVEKQWMAILHPRTLEVLQEILHRRAFHQFDARLWSYILYDFLVVYNLGEGDPDKVLHALYPLYLLRCGAVVTETNGSLAQWDTVVREQSAIFRQNIEYLVRRWESYVPPEE
jgi:hypothetical protein